MTATKNAPVKTPEDEKIEALMRECDRIELEDFKTFFMGVIVGRQMVEKKNAENQTA